MKQSLIKNMAYWKAKNTISPVKQEEEKKDFSDESKYKNVRKGRTGGIAQDIKSGKYYNTAFGHEMQSDTIRNPFDPSIYDVEWTKKDKEE